MGVLQGAGTGAAIGSAIPGVGTVAGAIAGGIIGLGQTIGGWISGEDKRVTKLQDSIEKLTKAQEQKTAAEYFYTQAQEKKVWEEVREQVVKADVAEDTKEAMIKRAGLENLNLMQAGIESITRQKLNSEQINYLKGQLAIGWANVAIGEKSVSNEADRIANDLIMGMKDLDRKDRELIKDWIYEGVHAGKEISGEILNRVMRGAPKTITEVTSRLEVSPCSRHWSSR